MIHLALAVGLVIAITLFVQHQRDRLAVRRTWEMPPPSGAEAAQVTLLGLELRRNRCCDLLRRL